MIQIINTGVANIRSLQAAFDRLGHPWNLTESVTDIEDGEHVVLPGVGAFAAAAESLDRLGVRDAIRSRLENPDKPTLCICLGMQLLCESSEEADSAVGLGVIPCTIKRFPNDVPVPQLGWNAVAPIGSDTVKICPYASGQAYFANSFRLVDNPPPSWGVAQTNYAGQFNSSIWRGRTLACQFHPELSGAWGQQVLNHWFGGTEFNISDLNAISNGVSS